MPLEVDREGPGSEESEESESTGTGKGTGSGSGKSGVVSTGISPSLEKLNMDFQKKLDDENRKIEEDRKRASEPEPGEGEGMSEGARTESIRRRRDAKKNVEVLDPTELINKQIAGALAHAKNAFDLAASNMKLTERELDRTAKESLKIVSNKGMDWAQWQNKIKALRELQFHEDMIDFREVTKGGKSTTHVECKILSITPHGKTVYMRMAKPEDRKELEKKLAPLLSHEGCHLMTPSSDSKECMLSASRACYKYLTKT